MARQPSARERLLDAAEELAFTQGVAATPVDRILQRANVSPATLYAHFGNKEGLIAQALRRRLENWDAAWLREIAAAATDRDRLLAVFPALTSYRSGTSAARWCAALGVAAETVDPGQQLAETLSQDTRLLTDRFRELAVPVVGADDADALAAQMLLIFTGVLGMLLRGNSPEAAAATGRVTAGFVIDGFGASASGA